MSLKMRKSKGEPTGIPVGSSSDISIWHWAISLAVVTTTATVRATQKCPTRKPRGGILVNKSPISSYQVGNNIVIQGFNGFFVDY
jgi:hypothetical protein